MPIVADAEMLPDSCEIDGYQFGGWDQSQVKVMIEDITFNAPDIITQDKQLPRSDGIRFGRDYRGGRTIAFDMHVFGQNGPQAFEVLDELTQAWYGDNTRTSPGAVQTLRIKRGSTTRRVYGRGRRLAPAPLRTSATGWSPVTAEFKTVDHYYYDDQEKTNTVSIIPTQGGGLLAPLAAPLSTLGVSYAPGEIFVEGTAACWPVYVVHGPINLPTVEVVGEYRITLGIGVAHDELLIIDTRPWTRGVRMGNGTSVAGALTPASALLRNARLKPGGHEIILSGLDETGTSSLTVAWRDVYVSL